MISKIKWEEKRCQRQIRPRNSLLQIIKSHINIIIYNSLDINININLNIKINITTIIII